MRPTPASTLVISRTLIPANGRLDASAALAGVASHLLCNSARRATLREGGGRRRRKGADKDIVAQQRPHLILLARAKKVMWENTEGSQVDSYTDDICKFILR